MRVVVKECARKQTITELLKLAMTRNDKCRRITNPLRVNKVEPNKRMQKYHATTAKSRVYLSRRGSIGKLRHPKTMWTVVVGKKVANLKKKEAGAET